MTVVEEIDALRKSLPGCSAIVFADLGAGMVLRASSDTKRDQEEYDALCAAATQALKGRAVAGALEQADQESRGATHSILMSAKGTQIFLRASTNTDEALCIVCELGMDVAKVIAAAGPVIRRISESDP